MDVDQRLTILHAAAMVRQSQQANASAHRSYVEHIEEQAVRDGAIEGHLKLNGAGESLAELHFPISFLEKPVFTCGFELAPDSFLTTGQFPVATATVYDWLTRGTDANIMYIGAKIAIAFLAPSYYTSGGDAGGTIAIGSTNGELHYSFRGKSFTNPSGSHPTVTAPL